VAELEVHSRIFNEMGFLPALPFNKINIHVGGTYGGEKEVTLRRFAQAGH
jgi:UV DNA damage endonuclease